MKLTILLVLGVLVLAAGLYFMKRYKALMLVKKDIEQAWGNIDMLLKQMHDELPKLVDLCRSSIDQEQDVFERISKARKNLLYAGGPTSKAQAELQLQGALNQLSSLAEHHPNLTAQTSFKQVKARIFGLESQISDRRKVYNDAVVVYNVRVRSRPDVFFTPLTGLRPMELFK